MKQLSTEERDLVAATDPRPAMNGTGGEVVQRRETVTPELADYMLSTRSPQQRALFKEAKVGPIERDLRNGRWVEKGDPIRFDWSGRLIDGQHRLEAIRRSGVTLELLVVRGLSPDAWRYIDLYQEARRPSDIRRAEGNRAGGVLYEAMVRLLWLYEAGVSLNAPAKLKPTAVERREVESRHPGLLDEAVFVAAFRKSRLRSPAVGLVLYLIDTKADHPRTSIDFREDLVRAYRGVELSQRHPAYVLNRFLKNLDKKQVKPHIIAHAVARAWQHQVSGTWATYIKVDRADLPLAI